MHTIYTSVLGVGPGDYPILRHVMRKNNYNIHTADGDGINRRDDNGDGTYFQNTIIVTASFSLFCALVFTIIGLFCGIYIRSKRTMDSRGTIAAINSRSIPVYEDITLNMAPTARKAEKLQVSENMAYGNF